MLIILPLTGFISTPQTLPYIFIITARRWLFNKEFGITSKEAHLYPLDDLSVLNDANKWLQGLFYEQAVKNINHEETVSFVILINSKPHFWLICKNLKTFADIPKNYKIVILYIDSLCYNNLGHKTANNFLSSRGGFYYGTKW